MGKRSRFKREERRITGEWVQYFCKPKLTKRDEEILQFINLHRIVTSEQVAQVFWKNSKQSQSLANRRLRILYDLHCIDRFFPPVDSGSSLQHLVLDSAGARILGIELDKIRRLPITYKHTVLTTECLILANKIGFGWGEREKNFNIIKPDIYYSNKRIAIEIDLGTESHKTLRTKAENYQRIRGLNWLIFITTGNPKRGNNFKGIGCRLAFSKWDDLPKLLEMVYNECG